MTKLFKISYEGKQYIWTGQRWFQADNYLIPPTAIIQILDRMRQIHQDRLYPQSQKDKTMLVIDKNNENNCTILTDLCVICNQPAPHGKALCDGRVYHSECYTKLSSLMEGQHKELADISARILEHKTTIKRANSWGHKIRTIFIGDDINISAVEYAITIHQAKRKELGEALEQNEQKIKKLWDYWLEYPPDWEERSRTARDDIGVCEKCGESGHLHVHHRQPVAKGGSHSRENLEILCVDCHGAIHGRDFAERKTQHTTLPSAYAERLAILRHARELGLIVHFSYRKFNGERSTRSFTPQRFKRYGNSLCIEGWCYLRDATRTFAISRMNGVKIQPSMNK